MGPGADRGASVMPGIALPERYQPLRRIARGGMASVWCALDHTLDRHVAIKLLAERYAHDELAGRRFTREARAAARLSGHPNVVTIYDVGLTLPSEEAARGRPFIVMEYLSGGTVADALRTGELDRPLILTWLRQAAAALDYAHRRGVIHRDVKLSNFLLDRDRVLHVADFGIAQLGTEDTLTSTGEVMGTAAYLAPERALGLPATESSDRYGMAVAAFELLVGQRPFTAEHFAAQARQHVEQPPPRASLRSPTLPAALDGVLARGMAKRQDERYGSAAEMVDQIEQALAPRPARPRRAAPATTVYSRRVRRRTMALSALVGVVACVVAAVLLASGTPRAAQHAASARHGGATQAARHTPPAQNAPTAASPATATALEAQGHRLMVGGDYQDAIPVLRRAVAAAPHWSLTYAYALYDLGRSLRLAGDPQAAVPILWQRLQIPNQSSVVRYELSLALQAAGQGQGSNGD